MMRRFLHLLLVFTFVICVFGCDNKNSEVEVIENDTAIKPKEEVIEEENYLINSKEEWEKLFNIDNYSNVYIEQICHYTDLDNQDTEKDTSYNQKVSVSIDHNMIKIENNGYSAYYYKDEKGLKIATFDEFAKNAYKKQETKYSKEELDKKYEELIASYVCGNFDFIKYYESAVLNEEKGCYSFKYVEEETSFDVEVYPSNGIIKSMSLNLFAKNDITNYRLEMNVKLSKIGEINLTLPSISNTAKDETAWDKLFDINKFKNCTVYKTKTGFEELSEIDNDLVHYTSMDNNTNEQHDFYYLKLSDNKQRVTEVKKDGSIDESEQTITGENGIRTFDDYYIVNTVGESYQGCFNEAIYVDDHYELTKEDSIGSKLIQIYVSNGYITNINIKETINNAIINQNIQITNYGRTQIQ